LFVDGWMDGSILIPTTYFLLEPGIWYAVMEAEAGLNVENETGNAKKRAKNKFWSYECYG
jgi:hypothetical protein